MVHWAGYSDCGNGSATTYSYAGNTVTVTDAAGKWKKYTMDVFGNVQQVDEPGSLVTQYGYVVLNHLTSVSMSRATGTQTRSFSYVDPATGHPGAYLRTATNPENGTVSYTYQNKLLASKTDAKGQFFQYY